MRWSGPDKQACETDGMGTSRHYQHNVPAARELRAHETPAEDLLWEELRGRRLDGLKFRRQHPIGPLVLDFCCPEHRLVIELDGTSHADQLERDAERDALLTAAGYRVLRFPNQVVHEDLSTVLDIIRAAAREASLWRPPDPRSSIWNLVRGGAPNDFLLCSQSCTHFRLQRLLSCLRRERGLGVRASTSPPAAASRRRR